MMKVKKGHTGTSFSLLRALHKNGLVDTRSEARRHCMRYEARINVA